MRLAGGAPGDPALTGPDGAPVSYRQLGPRMGEAGRCVDGLTGKGLVLISAPDSVDQVVTYLAVLEGGHAVLLADPRMDDAALTRLMENFRPDAVVRGAAGLPAATAPHYRPAAGPGALHAWRRCGGEPEPVHDDLALLLLTSGTVGTPKAVRLSARNVLSNAEAIGLALEIRAEDRAVASLPLHHSYGLSVLHSHLLAGACTVLTPEPPLTREFWRQVAQHRVTSLAGVPLMYEGWWRTLSRVWPASLRTATQAGGRLRPALARRYAELAARHQARFHVMYGQTEATARMSCLDLTGAPQHAGSVGPAVPGGRFRIAAATPGEAGQVVYEGPNVMMGYAHRREDLALGDEMGGVLRTGDLGTLRDGRLWLAGRISRITKVAGRRVSLDEFEEALDAGPAVAAAEHAGRIVLFAAGGWEDMARRRAEQVALRFGVPSSCVEFRAVDRIPTTPSRKTDYTRIGRLAGCPDDSQRLPGG